MSTGENVGYVHWKPAVMAETGGEFLLMHGDVPIVHSEVNWMLFGPLCAGLRRQQYMCVMYIDHLPGLPEGMVLGRTTFPTRPSPA